MSRKAVASASEALTEIEARGRAREGRRLSLFEILRRLGVSVRKVDIERINYVREMEPDATTDEILLRLKIAPKTVVEEAMLIAREQGSTEVLEDRVKQAHKKLTATNQASRQLANVATLIANKRPSGPSKSTAAAGAVPLPRSRSRSRA